MRVMNEQADIVLKEHEPSPQTVQLFAK